MLSTSEHMDIETIAFLTEVQCFTRSDVCTTAEEKQSRHT